MLDQLKAGPLSTGQLDRAFPKLSRFAVMQHLGVLEKSGLVLVRRTGRKRFNYLNPVPLRQVYERWVSGFMDNAAFSVLRLKEHAETAPPEMEMEKEPIRIETEVRVKAPVERVFRALTHELNEWWAFRTRPDAVIRSEIRVGGQIYEDWGEGNGLAYGTILQLNAPHKLHSRGPAGVGMGYIIDNIEELQQEGDETVYKKTILLWGHVPENIVTMFRDGSRAILEQMLRGYVEDGIKYDPSKHPAAGGKS